MSEAQFQEMIRTADVFIDLEYDTLKDYRAQIPLTFDIFWARDKVVVLEACADLANPDWVQVGTRTLTDNVTPFSDPEAASQPGRFYRLREQ